MIDMFDFEYDYECKECKEFQNLEISKCSCPGYKKLSVCFWVVSALLAALLLNRLSSSIDGGPEL
jgi:hypothetical protein